MTTLPFNPGNSHSYPIGTPGQAWGATELALWRARQARLRSYADDVLASLASLRQRFDVATYGSASYGDDTLP
jgi:hypothetical protein